MTEPTIICPNCKTEIKLTESLAAPLLESTRIKFEQQLEQKDRDMANRLIFGDNLLALKALESEYTLRNYGRFERA